MKFIELEINEQKSHYINVDNISYIHNNNGIADIYILSSDEPIKTRISYEKVKQLIINAPNF